MVSRAGRPGIPATGDDDDGRSSPDDFGDLRFPFRFRLRIRKGQFPEGSMGPKREACARFVEEGGRYAIVTSLEKAVEGLEGEGRDPGPPVIHRARTQVMQWAPPYPPVAFVRRRVVISRPWAYTSRLWGKNSESVFSSW